MANQKLVIYGVGAMARVAIDLISDDVEISGLTVDRRLYEKIGPEFASLPLVPFDDVERIFSPEAHEMLVAVGFRDMNALRAERMIEAEKKAYKLFSFCSRTARLPRGFDLNPNVVIMDHVSIHSGSEIGRGTFLTGGINLGHDCKIGAHCWINAGVTLAGNVRVGERCFFGVNAAVADDVSIGARTFVGANALIAEDTPDDSVMIAPPAERFRMGSAEFLNFAGLP